MMPSQFKTLIELDGWIKERAMMVIEFQALPEKLHRLKIQEFVDCHALNVSKSQ